MSGADAIVVGAGLVGVASAVAVAKAGLRTIHVAPKAPPDRRTSALMLPSVEYLRDAGLIGDPAALGTPLTRIRIIDATGRLIRAPEVLFDSAEAGHAAFAWNFPNTALLASFDLARAKLANLTTIEAMLAGLEHSADGWVLTLADGSTLIAPFVIGADGKKSFVRAAGGFRAREQGFTQAALVCDLELARPLDGASVEFHYEQGPWTLVPASERRANLVWIDDHDVLREAQAGGAEHLRQLFLEKSHRLFGDIKLLTPAHIFLLSTLTADHPGHDGIVLAGEAAHAFPPIGAQGLNLGLRDVADLAAAVGAADRSDPGWAIVASEDYSRRREPDLARTGTMVDALFRSLLADFLPVQAARAGGLWAMKALPQLRKRAFALGMGER